jgi:hypothetical protein
VYELVDERGRTLNLVLKSVRSGGAAWLSNMLPSMEREWAIGQRLGMHCRTPAGMSLAHRSCLLQGLVEDREHGIDAPGCLPYRSREFLSPQGVIHVSTVLPNRAVILGEHCRSTSGLHGRGSGPDCGGSSEESQQKRRKVYAFVCNSAAITLSL